MTTVEHAPALDGIEDAADSLRRELDAVLERARDAHRRLQDVDAELEDAADAVGGAIAQRHKLCYQLRIIARALTRAHCTLAILDPERADAAGKTLAWLGDVETTDAPWRSAA